MALEKEFVDVSRDIIVQVEWALILHDIGRFFQVNRKRVLSGKEREHWNKGEKMLSQDGYWKDFPLILLWVKYHNKYDISNLYKDPLFVKLSLQDKKYAEIVVKLVRDADKLQNMKYIAFDFEGFLKADKEYPKYPFISEEILLTYKGWSMLERDSVTTLAERVLCYVCWKDDLYFEETKQQLIRSGFFETVYNFLSNLGVEKKMLDRLKLV